MFSNGGYGVVVALGFVEPSVRDRYPIVTPSRASTRSIVICMKLSKTTYLLSLECEQNAWVKVHLPEVFNGYPLSDFEQNIIETGNEIDILARDLFPGGTLVAKGDVENTQKLIEAKTKVIYQPAFETEKYHTICDILVLNGEVYDLYEVKSSTTRSDDKNKKKKEELYVSDLSFQNEVIKQIPFIKIGRKYLVRLDKEYVRQGEIDINKLLKIEDYSSKVEMVSTQTKERMEWTYTYLKQEKIEIKNCNCIYKGRSAMCNTFTYLNPEHPKYSVHDISNIGKSKAKLKELVAGNIFSINDVPKDFELGDAQRNQVDLAQGKDTIVDQKNIHQLLETYGYPISFIDYETYASALPRFDEYSPFEQIPFQFSLHIVENLGAEPIHHDFLYTDATKPDKPFLLNLQKYLPKTGTIISWNKSFENMINKELGRRNSEYANFMEDTVNRTEDLRDFFTKQCYVHKDFLGKTSIKKVLPVIAPEFHYRNLEIQDGGQASNEWNKVVTNISITNEEKEIVSKNLLEYCKLDTYAMYLIWKHLLEIIR